MLGNADFPLYLSLNQHIMSITLLLRKKIGEATIYVRYKPSRDFDFFWGSPFSIDAEKWDTKNGMYNQSFKKKSPKDESQKILNKNIDEFNIKLNELKNSLNSFLLMNNYNVTKSQIKNFLDSKYGKNKKKSEKKVVNSTLYMSQLIEEYITERSVFALGRHKELTPSSIKKIRVIKNKLLKINPKLSVSDVNDDFRNKFTVWCTKNQYAPICIVKDLKYIKSFIKFAKSKKYKTSDDVAYWMFYVEQKDYKHPILNLEEIKKIRALDLNLDYLDNARDWLVIGCYMGLRVSDLLKLKKTDIIEEHYISLIQKKTNDPTTAIILDPVKTILDKRSGEFPRQISDQRFNEYIKLVCQLAGINDLIFGGKMINKRKVFDDYEKWQLVTSHICRRSYITNFRPVLGDEGIMVNTGHKTTSMVEHYDQNTLLEKAKKIRSKLSDSLELIMI